jgi:hypothetical protein
VEVRITPLYFVYCAHLAVLLCAGIHMMLRRSISLLYVSLNAFCRFGVCSECTKKRCTRSSFTPPLCVSYRCTMCDLFGHTIPIYYLHLSVFDENSVPGCIRSSTLASFPCVAAHGGEA